MLERYGLEAPVFMPSVEPRLSDIVYKQVFSLPQEVPTVDVATLMAKEGIRNVVITDASGKPVGMVGGACPSQARISRRSTSPSLP